MIKRKLTVALLGIATIVSGTTVRAATLPIFSPRKVTKIAYQVNLTPGGAINLKLDKQNYIVTSQFSKIPGWAKLEQSVATGFQKLNVDGMTFNAESGDFKLNRKLIKHDECVEIIDTLTNKTDKALPIMMRHQIKLGKVKELRLCGYKQYSRRARNVGSHNPTTIIIPKNGGSLGMLALSDVFRVHFMGFGIKGTYGIADNNLTLGAKKSLTIRWALFPAQQADYYVQINAMRRLLQANFTIKGGFAMLSPYKSGVVTHNPKYDRVGIDSSIDEIKDFYKFRNNLYSNAQAIKLNGEQYHGSAWLNYHKRDMHLKFNKMLRQADPQIQVMHYFHCYLDVKPYMKEDFPQCKTLTSTGKQVDYGNPIYPVYFPTATNKWGKLQTEHLKILLEEYNLDGIFWDEFTYSSAKYHYGQPWDGVTSDIDRRSHEIVRKKSSVVLLSLPWRIKAVNEIIKHKKFLIVNGGGGATDTMRKIFNKHKFIGFIETASASNCLNAQLQSPIGLGDHLTERTEVDCYRGMVKLLEYGCLYFWYSQEVAPVTHSTLTKYMFPTTPVELHNGFIIAQERILTMKSGWFSFGGMENAEAHFYDKNGYEVKRQLESKTENGKRFFKIELAEFESCALVKK